MSEMGGGTLKVGPSEEDNKIRISPKRKGRIEVPWRFLENLLHLPEGVRIAGVCENGEKVVFYLEGSTILLPPQKNNLSAPLIDVDFKEHPNGDVSIRERRDVIQTEFEITGLVPDSGLMRPELDHLRKILDLPLDLLSHSDLDVAEGILERARRRRRIIL